MASALATAERSTFSMSVAAARCVNARIVLASGTLLASSFLFDSREQETTGSGLTGYSLDGRRRFHLYGRQRIGVQPLGRRALVGGLKRTSLIDARTGQPLRRYRRFTMSLLAGDAPFHY